MKNMTTAQINKVIEVRKIKDMDFGQPKFYTKKSGFAFYVEGLGYYSIKGETKASLFGKTIQTPYVPAGGKRTCLDILAQGGFCDYDNACWVNPMAVMSIAR